jgi:uncharacterized protein YdeI (YjbR/CyaY-like superfamily)
MSRKVSTNYSILPFKTAEEFATWLATYYSSADGIWIRIYKKDSDLPTISHAEALDEALCYGWIDSLAKKYDDISYIQKFTPRRPKSLWSKRNIEHIERLIKEGRMKDSGMKEVELAKQDGRWQKAYNSPSTMEVPADFIDEVSKHKKAKKFFDSLNKANTYAIGWQLQTAKKPETREKRFKKLLELMMNGEKLH